MQTLFQPQGMPTWIGSLPMDSHEAALELMLAHTPEIPIWIQLPHFKREGMIIQFAEGMPGLTRMEDRIYVNDQDDGFDQSLLEFFEAYLAVSGGEQEIADSRFSLNKEDAPGFYALMERLASEKRFFTAVKGQVTGPFTFGTGLVDHEGRAVFYSDQLRDAAVKMIAMKARWQVNRMKGFGVPVIVFLDEPALAGFGSSAFISVSQIGRASCRERVSFTV